MMGGGGGHSGWLMVNGGYPSAVFQTLMNPPKVRLGSELGYIAT